jgi:putative PIN family toxin of toxin-antitoxin system
MKSIIVIDLNVFVRALLTSGADRVIYQAIEQERITPAFSHDLLENLTRVLLRPKLKLALPDIKELLEIIKAKAVMVKPEIKINACRDASDNIIIETAIAAGAKTIITNDADLLSLNPFQNIAILDARQFIKILRKL